MSNQSGILFVVATPIGNIDDISNRALEIFRQVKYIAAEDTRHSRKLFERFHITPRLVSYHDFNEDKSTRKLIKFLESGDDIALVSDAGTPLISDPGYSLVKQCRNLGIRVVPVPGPSALTCALSVSGLATNSFLFEGFFPEKQLARKACLNSLKYEWRTLVFYESPHRILASLEDIQEIFGPERKLVIAREMTKLFETFREGSVAEIIKWMNDDRDQQKGEFVVMIEGMDKKDIPSDYPPQEVLAVLLEELPLKKAASLAAKITGESRNYLYKIGLQIQEKH